MMNKPNILPLLASFSLTEFGLKEPFFKYPLAVDLFSFSISTFVHKAKGNFT